MTTTLRGWLMRDKGLFYLGTPTGWWRLENLNSGLLARFGVRPESPVLVQGRPSSGHVFQVEHIGCRGRPGGSRPEFVADPVPQLFLASDLRLHVHTWLRKRHHVELSLPLSWEGVCAPVRAAQAAIAAGIDRFFAFARAPTQSSDADELLEEREQLLIVDDTENLDAAVRLINTLIAELAAVVGVTVSLDAVAVAPFDRGSLQRLEVPESWSESACAVVRKRLRGAGASIREVPRSDGRIAWLVDPGTNALQVRRLLDLAESAMLGQADASLQLATTWYRNPLEPHTATAVVGTRDVATVRRVELDDGFSESGFVASVAWEELVAVLGQLPWSGEAQLFPRSRSAGEVLRAV